jgi:nucleoside 2-deoxyribosyltransferase
VNGPAVYLCGPIVQDIKLSNAWRVEAAKQLNPSGIITLDPCRGKDWSEVHSSGMDTTNHLFTNGRFVHRDLSDIRRSSAVLFNWPCEPGRQSIGTFMEIGYAVARGIPVVAVCAESSTPARHPFITELCVSPFALLDDACDYLIALLR